MTQARNSLLALWRAGSPAARQTAFLFGVDTFTNVVDYGFHVYLGRALSPGEFAVVQTINAAILILVTACGVMQPVVARLVAEDMAAAPDAATGAAHSRTIFQAFFRTSALIGLGLTGVAWLGRNRLGAWLNVPALLVGLASSTILLALLRPVVAGVLLGQQRFVALGSTRSVHAVVRLVTGVVLVSLGAGVVGAVAAFPAGSLLALISGLGLLGLTVWQPGAPLRAGMGRDSVRLSAGAFVAYTAYMSLLSTDLIWVNRGFSPAVAGSYATAVLLRRILALLPAAVIVVMYPRAVIRVSRGRLPDDLLWKTSAVVTASTLVLTAFYFACGPAITRFAFGAGYGLAAPLLGWMGVAMLGYGLGSVWLNFYLATRPLPFVLLVAGTALVQQLLLAQVRTVMQVTAVFLFSGWLLAVGGLLIYLFVLRPQLRRRAGPSGDGSPGGRHVRPWPPQSPGQGV